MAGCRELAALLLVMLVLAGCGGGAPAPAADAGADGASIDAALDAGADAAGGGCVRGTLGAWQLESFDDVSVSYFAPFVDPIAGQRHALYLTFERYGDTTYTGTFTIDGSRDANRSTCAHCVMAFSGLARDHGFFAESGVLTLNRDPFELVLDATLTDLRMIEVTIGGDTLVSTPVPDGLCIELASVAASGRFAPPGWTCPDARYADGTRCDCNCGLFDPDCDGARAPADCAADELCELRRDGPIGATFCAASCSRAAGVECVRGVCALDYMLREYCEPSPLIRSTVGLGEICPSTASYCAPVGTSYFDGICDFLARNDGVCRPRCTMDAECDLAALEHCVHFVGETGAGLCAPRYPAAWTCAGARYEDGVTCDCGCGAHDTDCDLPGAPVGGCGAGEICTALDECAAVPANDGCRAALPLAVGTSAAAPARSTGTTRGAANDYATRGGTGACVDVFLDGPDVVYALTLRTGQSLDVVATPATANLALYLLGPGDASACDATASRCIGGVETGGGGEPETLHVTATAAGTYYLVVDSFASIQYGDFTLDAWVSP